MSARLSLRNRLKISREHIRYGHFWVRLVCCFAVAVAASNAVYFGLLDACERVARDYVLEAGVGGYAFASCNVEIIAIFALCLVPPVFRVERPLAMAACGVILVLSYVLLVVLIVLLRSFVLPLVAPLLGLVGSTIFLGAMAWSEEREKRKKLEYLEIARQKFADMLVHDLRKRVSSILMSCSLIENGAGNSDGERRKGMLETVRASARRMLIQVDDLLAIRKMEENRMPLKRENAQLRNLVRESLGEHRS